VTPPAAALRRGGAARLPGACVTERAPGQRMDSRQERSGPPQADRSIGRGSAASARARRREPDDAPLQDADSYSANGTRTRL
jgi:hypothetical protein